MRTLQATCIDNDLAMVQSGDVTKKQRTKVPMQNGTLGTRINKHQETLSPSQPGTKERNEP